MSSSWQLQQTHAFKIFSTSGVEKTRLMLRLMHHALQAVNHSPTRDKNRLYDQDHADFHAEIKTNPELHASLDCMREMLKDKLVDPVQPHGSVTAKDGTLWSPLQKAAAIQKDYPQLGDYIGRHLKTHQSTLLFKEMHPDVWEEAYRKKQADRIAQKRHDRNNPHDNLSSWERFLAM